MNANRRYFLRTSVAAVTASLVLPKFARGESPNEDALDQAAERSVLDATGFKEPVVIESVELLRKGREYFVRVRSKDGAEGISVDNGRAELLAPIMKRRVMP